MSSSYFSYIPPTASTPWFEPSQNPWTPRSPGFPQHPHDQPLLSPRADAPPMPSPAQASAQRPSASPHQPSSARPRHDSASAATAAESAKASAPRSLSFTLPTTLCCSRCRRENGHASMFQFGKNLYYCSHCARMVGYVG